MKKIITSWILSFPFFSFSQNVGIGTTTPLARLHVTDSNVIFSAPMAELNPAGFTISINGPGTRLMWLPKKSAFRAGTVYNNYWDADSIGTRSFATGFITRATGSDATAIGYGTNASGAVSTAMGFNTTARGDISTAMGSFTTASGNSSTAMGLASSANGYVSTAIGSSATANGDYSASIGNVTAAPGYVSTAFGNFTTAAGNFSTTAGNYTTAKAFASLATGQYNDSISSSSNTTWVSTDPLFYIGNGTSNASRHNAMVVYKNGNMVLKNPTTVLTNPVGFTVPVSGAGTRMMWLPEKSAFRAGTVDNNNWNADSIGLWSFAIGFGTKATGDISTAMGGTTIASGENSTAMGGATTASGSTSTAMGNNTTASGFASTAMGSFTTASGTASTTMGNSTTASGLASTAMGNSTTASGLASTATGSVTIASGDYSTAIGNNTTASGGTSTAIGNRTIAKSYASLATGSLNDTLVGTSANTWVNTDPLFYIGNGNPAGSVRSNALVVYKNADIDINGYTRLGKLSEGAPVIKTKKLTGTGPVVNGSVPIAHGLNAAKIIFVTVLMEFGSGPAETVPPFYTISAGYEYQYQVRAADIFITNKNGNSANLGNKPVKILITYEE